MIEIKDIEKLAELSRLEIPQEEKLTLQKDLGAILDFIGQIEEANIKSDDLEVKDTALIYNVLREDGATHESGIFTDALIAEAPHKEDNYLKVKKIL